jgi:exopolysaccharide biosynthesis polyprenyl glycosylphosphotransferase
MSTADRIMQSASIPPVASSHERPLRVIVLCLDALIVAVSMACSWLLHMQLLTLPTLRRTLGLRAPPAFEDYALLLYLTLPLFLSMTAWFGLHRWFERAFTRLSLLVGMVKVHLAVLLGLALLSFLTQTAINRSIVGLFLVCTFVLQLGARGLLSRWQHFQHTTGHARARVVLVGDAGKSMRDWVERSQRAPFPPEIVGSLNELQAETRGWSIGPRGEAMALSVPQRGQLSDLERLLLDEPVDRVLFFPPLNDSARVREALRLCETLGVPAGLAIDMVPHSVARPRVEFVFGHPFVEFELAPRAPGPLLIKHAIDVVAAALGLVLLSPLLLVVALSILLTMGRPILFIQERAGRRGRPFRMFKFRTMVTDAEAQKASLMANNIMAGPVFKVRDDPRVTRLGRLLRSSSLDELPQLLNVVAGQMSLIGPRPLPRAEQEKIVGWHRRRLSMKPGMTGLWQVSGRSNVDFDQWMKLDLQYVDTWSLRQDARILLKTIPVLLHRKGAH